MSGELLLERLVVVQCESLPHGCWSHDLSTPVLVNLWNGAGVSLSHVSKFHARAGLRMWPLRRATSEEECETRWIRRPNYHGLCEPVSKNDCCLLGLMRSCVLPNNTRQNTALRSITNARKGPGLQGLSFAIRIRGHSSSFSAHTSGDSMRPQPPSQLNEHIASFIPATDLLGRNLLFPAQGIMHVACSGGPPPTWGGGGVRAVHAPVPHHSQTVSLIDEGTW